MDRDEKAGPAMGARIRMLRKTRNWTQMDLAGKAGVSLRSIGSYEREGPPLARLAQLDQVFAGELGTQGCVGADLAGVSEAPPVNDPPALTTQDVTRAVEPLGVLLDELVARVAALESGAATEMRQ